MDILEEYDIKALDAAVDAARREKDAIPKDSPLYLAALQGMCDACRAREQALFNFNYPAPRKRK